MYYLIINLRKLTDPVPLVSREPFVIPAMSQSSSQSDTIFLATLAEQAERYDDMAEYMKQYMESSDADVKNSDNRNLLSVAFKNVVGAKRSSWRIISNEERKCTDEFKKQILLNLGEKVKKELKETCNEVLVRVISLINTKTARG